MTDTVTDKAESLTQEQVLARIREASLAAVADSADVIARGTIGSKWNTEYTLADGRIGALTHYRLFVQEGFKGVAFGDSLEFVTPIYPRHAPGYMPKWYRLVPRGIREGQEWYVLLKRGERGLYPFVGPNSLLLVQGNALIYDMKMEYEHDVRGADRVIRAEVRNVPE